MADENQIPKVMAISPPERKSVTHKQVLGGAGLALALYWMPQLKSLFFTREEGAAQVERVSNVELALTATENKINARIDRSTDLIIQRIKDAEDRATRNADRIERRVDNLEVVTYQLPRNNRDQKKSGN